MGGMAGKLLRLLTGSVLCVVLVAGLTAPRMARADDPNTEAAKIHYKAGEQYYLRGLYSQAIAEFNEAYRLSKAAALLFNMSQAYERMGDLPSARDYLKRYMESGDAETTELPALKEKIGILDQRIAGDRAAREQGNLPPPPAPADTDTDKGPSRPFKTWKWVAGGVGVGMVGLSVLFMLDGQKQEQNLEAYLEQHPMADFMGEPRDIYNRGQRANSLAAVFGIGGLALVGTGVLLYVLDARHSRTQPEHAGVWLAPVVGPRAFGATAVLRF